jgi:hypothetical protein
VVTHPYERGREDYADGLPLSDNPYDAGTEDAVEWDRGWQYEMSIHGREGEVTAA